jgi:hypothetical protein
VIEFKNMYVSLLHLSISEDRGRVPGVKTVSLYVKQMASETTGSAVLRTLFIYYSSEGTTSCCMCLSVLVLCSKFELHHCSHWLTNIQGELI